MRAFYTAIFILAYSFSSAQGYGMQWVLGYNESVLDFRNDTLVNYPIASAMSIFLTEANICDSSGNLLYYTNGIYIAGSDGNQIANGDSLSPCQHTNDNACCGLDIPQGSLFLPMPDDSRYYYLFHFSDDSADNLRPGTAYYSLIDIEGNSGAGEVIKKNIVIFHDILRAGGMTACKHANGRDYWIILPGANNVYYKLLLTPDSILGPFTQTIGPIYTINLDIAYSKFSQDGSKYVTSCYQGPILVMDFDRCNGEFRNPIIMFNQDTGATVEFSPNGRFVYATNSLNLTQFDLSLPNPQHDSITLYQTQSNDLSQMHFLQLAPNGKLYASCFNGGFYILHAVNYPDLKGDSAVYVDTAFRTLTANTVSLPNMINYQLGALAGSDCDTIWPTGVANVAANNLLRLMPNPADKYVYVEMGMQGNYEFDLVNAVGQVVDKRETRQVDIFDTEHLAGGVYFIRAIDKNTNNAVLQKVVVQH